MTSGQASALASSMPRLGPVTALSPPSITSEEQLIRRQRARMSSVENGRRPWSASIVSASVSIAQPTASSIALVECGSVKTRETKNSAKARQSCCD